MWEAAYVGWALGFLSGTSEMAHLAGWKPLRLPDADSVNVYLDNYCHAHPLKAVVDGVEDLMIEIHQTAERSNG
jgi:hypothetical protein